MAKKYVQYSIYGLAPRSEPLANVYTATHAAFFDNCKARFFTMSPTCLCKEIGEPWLQILHLDGVLHSCTHAITPILFLHLRASVWCRSALFCGTPKIVDPAALFTHR